MNCKLKELAKLHCDLAMKVKAEYDNLDIKMDLNEPAWSLLLKKGKLEFCHQIVMTMPSMVLSEEEYKAMLSENILELCFAVWAENGTDIPETIEFVAEVLTQDISECFN